MVNIGNGSNGVRGPNWKTLAYGAATIALGAFFIAAGGYGARVAKTPPPWASDDAFSAAFQKLLDAQQEANVKAAWWRCINAVEAQQSLQAIDVLSNQLASEKLLYLQMTGKLLPLECPMAPGAR